MEENKNVINDETVNLKNCVDETVNNETQNEGACDNCRKKETNRDAKEYRDLINRLSRIEGQVRGIKRMVENGVYCPDILVQAAAVNAAVNSFSRVLLSDHIKTCVANDLRKGSEESVDELILTLQKMMK